MEVLVLCIDLYTSTHVHYGPTYLHTYLSIFFLSLTLSLPRYNGGPLPDIALSVDSQLVLLELTTNNSGNYMCTVRNATYTFFLDVTSPTTSEGRVLSLCMNLFAA